jgi:hypothetical protein
MPRNQANWSVNNRIPRINCFPYFLK